MARNGILLVAIFVVFTSLTFQGVFGIKCWDCTSTASFCDDTFDESSVSDTDRRWSYVECTPPPQPYDQKTVCKKVKQIVNDKTIISRSCVWENVYAPNDECMNENTPSSVKTEFCETCDSDGCNGAAQYGPAAILVIASAIVAKISLF